MNKRVLNIGGEKVTFSGLVFNTYFAWLILVTMIMVLVASIKYVFTY